eukprot:8321290-Heterocapsa_arctica.AAC.1
MDNQIIDHKHEYVHGDSMEKVNINTTCNRTKVAERMKENKTRKTSQHSSMIMPTMKVKRIWEKLNT